LFCARKLGIFEVQKMSFENITIFAPATLIGESGITVIRISGGSAFDAVSKIFSKNPGEFFPVKIEDFKSGSVQHGYIFDGNNFIDEAVVTRFKAPNSYTGEDVVEISSHGGAFIFRKINNLLIRNGLHHAEPGEFSKRAFLNGKMDLAQAEAVADLIKAKTEQANKLALKQLSGEFSSKIKNLREELINYCSLLELELDFSEEGLDLVSRETLLKKIDILLNKFQSLTRTFESGKIIQNGVNLAIIGRPNVGKSTIFNYLLDENRAIVSDIPGTTRDYLKEPLVMGGIQFNLIDTAGIRDANDSIEVEGVRRSKQKIEESDLVLEVEDLSEKETSLKDLNGNNEDKVIKVYNKADLSPNGKIDGVSVSAKTGYKMDELQHKIVEKAKLLINIEDSSELIITNERHRDCMLKSCEYLVNAKNQILKNGGNELISFEIRSAMMAIEDIIGRTANVDILNNIFSKFCIGK
jgi:tRNA modification GTPase